MPNTIDLHNYLFDAKPHTLSGALLGWMQSSARFCEFLDTYRDKIRKKIRVARDAQAALDLGSELEAAYHLLGEPRFSLAYEPYNSQNRRGPDFAVTYRGSVAFNVEVTRVRGRDLSPRPPSRSGKGVPFDEGAPPGMEDVEPGVETPGLSEDLPTTRQTDYTTTRLTRTLLAKLGQMQAGMPNVLMVHAEAAVVQGVDLAALMQDIKRKADRKDPALFALGRYRGPAEFYKDFLRLSAVVLWAGAGMEGKVWVNPQTRWGLEEKIVRIFEEMCSMPAVCERCRKQERIRAEREHAP